MARATKNSARKSSTNKSSLSKNDMAAKKKMLLVIGKESIAAASLPTLRAEDIQTSRSQPRLSSSGLLTGRGRGHNIVWGDMDPRDSIRILDTDPVDRVVRIDFDPTDSIPLPGPFPNP
jgi:hypothetical protein